WDTGKGPARRPVQRKLHFLRFWSCFPFIKGATSFPLPLAEGTWLSEVPVSIGKRTLASSSGLFRMPLAVPSLIATIKIMVAHAFNNLRSGARGKRISCEFEDSLNYTASSKTNRTA
ncbi:mCG145938, partial [Mus musculus]